MWLYIPKSGRRNGKTLAYCLRLLLETREAFDIEDFYNYRGRRVKLAVDDNDCGSIYVDYFCNYISNLAKILMEAGLNINLRRTLYYELSIWSVFITS